MPAPKNLLAMRFRITCIALLGLLLTGCGFHLRQSVGLPPSMQSLSVEVGGNTDLRRQLLRALQSSGADVVDVGSPGVAVMQVPVVRFSTDALTVSGYARVREYRLRLQVQFKVLDAAGNVLVEPQHIHMDRVYTYDQSQAIGSASREEQIRESLIDDMVQAILRRLEAAGSHPPS